MDWDWVIGKVIGGLYDSVAKGQVDRNRVSILGELERTCQWPAPGHLVRAGGAN